MAMYHIQSWKLCYIARHHPPLQSIALGLRKHNLLVTSWTVQLLITQLGCPPLADISLQGISCTFAYHNKLRHVCALRTVYSLAQWLNFQILNLQYAKCPTQTAYHWYFRWQGYSVAHSSSTSKRQSTSPSTWMATSNHGWRLGLLQAMWCWMTYSGSY